MFYHTTRPDTDLMSANTPPRPFVKQNTNSYSKFRRPPFVNFCWETDDPEYGLCPSVTQT